MAFETEWIRGSLDDPLEAATFAMLRIDLDGQIVTRLYDRVAGGERDSINVALYPFALSMAKNWWRLLYEPRKSDQKDALADVSHSLDAFMTGFTFPAINLWSDGDDAVSFEIPDFKQKFSSIEFLPVEHRDVVLSRAEVESNLFELVQKVVDRLSGSANGAELREVWERLCASLRDAEERRYCIAAGQLGLDPYDPDQIDVASLSIELSDRLFSDICEAATPREVRDATAWAREGVRRLVTISDIVGELGNPTPRDPKTPIWEHGYQKARSLRQHLSLDGVPPRRVIDQIFDGAVRGDHVPQLPHPYSLHAVTGRDDRALKIALPNVSAKKRRSTLCRALYVAWRTHENEASAVTTAGTLDQQASRAFAAELLAPEDQLRECAGADGLTDDDIERIAEENVCPEATVIWNAYNHDIPLRGVPLPTPSNS
jgi:hypothetical protein